MNRAFRLEVFDCQKYEKPATRTPRKHVNTVRPFSNWEDAHNAERATAAMQSVCFFLVMAALNPIALAIAHDYAPRFQLPDVVFSMVDEQPWARVVSDVGVACAAVVSDPFNTSFLTSSLQIIVSITLILHRYRLLLTRRIGFLAGCMYLLRVR